ncbi:MAG: hypothetical protein ACFFDP_04010 [Promethearchaeota archaeon]
MSIMDNLMAIENQLEKEGDTKRVRKAFWRIVGRIKRLDPSEKDDEVIEKAAEIRNRLFKQKVVLSIRKGIPIFSLCAIIFFALFIWATLFLSLDILWMNIVIFLISFILLYCLYPLGRYLGGLIGHVKFDGLYRYSPGELGLKIEYVSYLKTTRRRRKWIFGFSIIWILTFLFIELLIVVVFNPIGIWAPLFSIAFYLIFLTAIHRFSKTGELHRFIREFRIEREMSRKRKT